MSGVPFIVSSCTVAYGPDHEQRNPRPRADRGRPGLTKRYGDLVAVDAIDLEVGRGDVYGLLGPNGAGKTTFMRMLFGLIRPDDGRVEISGVPVQPVPVRALGGVAGFVETPRFYPYLTGRKNLELLARLDGNGGRQRIDEVLDLVELTDRAGSRVREYSYGMVQRLGVAAALMREPRLLVLDEPTNGLDPAGIRDMRALIQRLADSGLTVLLSSHHMAEVDEMCTRVAILRRGQLAFDGSMSELRGRAGRATRHLVTTDDVTALTICHRTPGSWALPRRAHALSSTPTTTRWSDSPVSWWGAGSGFGSCTLPPRRSRRCSSASPTATRSTRRRRHEHDHQPGHPHQRHRAPVGTTARRRRGVRRGDGQAARQTKVRVISLVMLAAPWVFILLVLHQDRLPLETLYGRYLKVTGFATPMVVLVTAAQWLLPLIAAFISGDMFSSEDNHGTFKTILTRSVTRGEVYWGRCWRRWHDRAPRAAIGASSLLAGLVCVGAQDFVSVGGTGAARVGLR